MSLVLADTSVWVAHFRHANPVLQSLVTMDRVLCHPRCYWSLHAAHLQRRGNRRSPIWAACNKPLWLARLSPLAGDNL